MPAPKDGALTYRAADDPRWYRRLNRIAALIVFVFVLLHVGMHALAGVSPDAFNTASTFYQRPTMLFIFTVVLGLLIFHALHGIRVLLIDLTAWGGRRAAMLRTVVAAGWAIFFIPVAHGMLAYSLAEQFGQVP